MSGERGGTLSGGSLQCSSTATAPTAYVAASPRKASRAARSCVARSDRCRRDGPLSIAFLGPRSSSRPGTPIGSPRFGLELRPVPADAPALARRREALRASTTGTRSATDHSTADDSLGVFHLVTLGTWVVFVGALGRPTSPHPELAEGRDLLGARVAARSSSGRALARSYCRQPAVRTCRTASIVGAGDVGQLVARKIQQHPEYGISLVGFVDDEPRAAPREVSTTSRCSAGSSDLAQLVSEHAIERVIVAFSGETPTRETMAARARRSSDQDVMSTSCRGSSSSSGPRRHPLDRGAAAARPAAGQAAPVSSR